jgi:hypothetical protein
MNMNILEYINDARFKIYKKKLCSKKGNKYQTYYLIVNKNKIIDILWEVESGKISEESLAYDNAELVVYKVVEKIDNRYFSFWNKDRIEYIIDQEIQCDTEFGMFFCKSIEQARNENFGNATKLYKLKAKVKIDDLIGGDLRSLLFKRCIPIEITD